MGGNGSHKPKSQGENLSKLLELRTGNGTTAIYIALKAMGCSGDFVALPATICPSVVSAIFASSNRPYFVDIERQTYGMDEKKLETILPNVKAVIAVHAFGIPCQIEKIKKLCQARDLPLIEDCAQAEGAEVNGASVGGVGDIAIHSYGAGKIIDAGGGGLGIASDSLLFRNMVTEYDSLPEKPDMHAANDLAQFYKFFYNQFFPDQLSEYRPIFSQLIKDFGLRLLARHSSSLDSSIDQAKLELSENILSRRVNAGLYRELLGSDDQITLLNFSVGSVPWRFNLWLKPKTRDYVLREMIKEGFNVSSWYPNIGQFLDAGDYKTTPLPNSSWLEGGILNLWVDKETTPGCIKNTCNKIIELTHNCPD